MLFMFLRNPELPYLSKIERGLPVGRKIIVDGCVDAEAKLFTVNLNCGPGKGDEIAFHFNPRFSRYTGSTPCVVRNTCTTFLGWGAEERRQSGQFPFKEGRQFRLEIICEQNSFIMNIDGKFFDFYNHRVNLGSITHLEIHGDIKVSAVQIIEGHRQMVEDEEESQKSLNSSSSSLNKESTEVDSFCKMLAEKLKRLPVQKAIYAQTLIINKVFEIEIEAASTAAAPTAAPVDKIGWNIFP